MERDSPEVQKEIHEGEADWDKCALRHIYQAYKATAAP